MLVHVCAHAHTHTHTHIHTHTHNIVVKIVHVFYSPFFQSLITLAANLELDTLDCCRDSGKWSWFSQFCMALRTAKSLQYRTPLPMQFVQEVNEKVSILKQDGEPDDGSYLDHKILKQEHDEQLLLWMQR